MKVLQRTTNYIRKDWQSSRTRVIAEIFAWACSVVSAVMFAVTAPNIPIVPLYGIFISGCVAAGWAAWTRGSFGILANYTFLVVIDAIGLVRILFFTGGS